ncbi:MAG: hypothetical protein JJT81_01830 [Rubellimicrobium sp.]|nr:hypothetical protein [Rubellimicrobium sp.]
MSKTFTYVEQGLTYEVTIFEDPDSPGQFFANITVLSGAMDVNAIYFGDEDFSGASASLGGPLNMNGARLDGEDIQWDQAIALSSPGLGREGTDKETFLSEGETLTVALDISSLDDIHVFGVRATSTTTPEGSIKGVSEAEEEPEEPADDPIFDKIGFGEVLDGNGDIAIGVLLGEEDLPEGQDGTFADYLNLYVSLEGFPPLSDIQAFVFYDFVEVPQDNGPSLVFPQEVFRLNAPEGGFETVKDALAAFDEAWSADNDADGASVEGEADDGASVEGEADDGLMAALFLPADHVSEMIDEDDVSESESAWV